MYATFYLIKSHVDPIVLIEISLHRRKLEKRFTQDFIDEKIKTSYGRAGRIMLVCTFGIIVAFTLSRTRRKIVKRKSLVPTIITRYRTDRF